MSEAISAFLGYLVGWLMYRRHKGNANFTGTRLNIMGNAMNEIYDLAKRKDYFEVEHIIDEAFIEMKEMKDVK